MALAGLASAGLANTALAVTGASARGVPSSRGSVVRLGAPTLRPSDARPIGSLPRSISLRLTIALTPRDPAALAGYAKAVAAPGSASYHHFLTVSQFARRFGAPRAAIAAVAASLRAGGLTPGPPAANGLSIPVRGSAGDVSTAFRTTLTRLRLRGGRIAIANTSAPELPRVVAPDVQAIIGLSTVATPGPAGLASPPPAPATSGDVARPGAAHTPAHAGAARTGTAHADATPPHPGTPGPADRQDGQGRRRRAHAQRRQRRRLRDPDRHRQHRRPGPQANLLVYQGPDTTSGSLTPTRRSSPPTRPRSCRNRGVCASRSSAAPRSRPRRRCSRRQRSRG
jgi:hypothetical protein